MKTNLEKLRLLFDDGSEHSYRSLTKKLSLTDRQVRRLIGQLKNSGVEVKEMRRGKEKIFSVLQQHQRVRLTELDLTQEELKALTLSVKASRAMLAGTPHFEPLSSVFDKLLEKANPLAYIFDLEEQLREWYFENSSQDNIALDTFRLLEKAMEEKLSVKIDYRTANTGEVSYARKLDPYFITRRGRAWMLVAYCHKRRDMRNFALARISKVDLCNPEKEIAYFDLKAGFDPHEYFRGAFSAINSDTCYELRILVEPEKAVYFKDRKYHPTQIIEEERMDDSLVVSFEIEGFEEMRSFCQSWGRGITVLEPLELRQRLLEEATDLLQRYK